MVVAEKDVVQLVLFNLFFQPMGIFGKVFAFQSYFYVDLVPVFFLSKYCRLSIYSGNSSGKHTHIGYVVWYGTSKGYDQRNQVFWKPPLIALRTYSSSSSDGVHATCGMSVIVCFHCCAIIVVHTDVEWFCRNFFYYLKRKANADFVMRKVCGEATGRSIPFPLPRRLSVTDRMLHPESHDKIYCGIVGEQCSRRLLNAIRSNSKI